MKWESLISFTNHSIPYKLVTVDEKVLVDICFLHTTLQIAVLSRLHPSTPCDRYDVVGLCPRVDGLPCRGGFVIITTLGRRIGDRSVGVEKYSEGSCCPSSDVCTEDSLQYKFYPVTSQVFRFKVKTSNDAHIALTPAPVASEPIIEIIIGGCNNTRSMIIKNNTKPENCANETKDILNGDEDRGFCVRWTDDTVYVKCEGDYNDFLAWKDPELFKINFVGLRTCSGAKGAWAIQVPIHYGTWQEAEHGHVPEDAVVGGQDCTGELVYVAKASLGGVTTPGKLVTSHGCALIPWMRKEHRLPTYKVLVGGPHNWVFTSGNNVPPGAFPAGKSEDGELLFIGRVRHAGSVTTGRVQKSHGVCYISFGGEELMFNEYEVLTE